MKLLLAAAVAWVAHAGGGSASAGVAGRIVSMATAPSRPMDLRIDVPLGQLGQLVGPDRVATMNGEGRLIVWDVAGAKRAGMATGVDLEQRLKTLKELRDKNLISEEAYRAKMQELLSEL